MNPEYNNETLREASMKIWNSRVGREVAKELKKYNRGKNLDENQIKSLLAYSISEKLYDDKMITSLNDNKNYDDFDEIYFAKPQSIEPSKPSDKVLEGSIEQNVAQNDNKQFADSNTDTRYEYIKTPCVGSYEVSGYTKKDGTEVDDYIRTCGAKHIRKVKKKSAADNYMDKNVTVQQPSEQAVPFVKNNDIGYKQIKNIHNLSNNNTIFSSPWNTPYNIKSDKNIFEIQTFLSEINNNVNKNNKNAKLLMNISIYSPKFYEKSKDFKYLNYDNVKEISDKIKVETIEKLDGVYFDETSALAQSIIKSKEFINEIQKEKLNNFKNQKIQISFNTNEDLFRGLHNVTVCNLHMDKKGYTHGIIYDKFDFVFLLKELFTKHDFITFANNIAYLLQQQNIIKKYYIFIKFKIKL